ncbi:MAG: DNA polymerase III subunit gamma/tau [Patescibacteria group bacterium]
MSLYLTYRPKSFADVLGQDHIVTTLEHAVSRDQLVHAYLFFGPRGTGKTSVARILAKILLIRKTKDEKLQQQILKGVEEGTLVDLIEIDAATNRQIDDVRDLKEKVQFAPTVASAKVYIIDEVHMMTKEAFNALLKTLEEPPDHAYFILATTELHKVPETIQSRCQRFPFRNVGDEDIVRGLQIIADKERITVERGALRAIARHVQGGMRDAIALLEQLASLGKVTEEDVRLRIGESVEEEVENLWSALEAQDRGTVLGITAALQERGVALEVFLRQLLARTRRDLHDRIGAGEEIAPAIARMDAIFQALRDLRVSPVPEVALEAALVGLCLQEGDGKGKERPKNNRAEKTSKEKEEKAESAPAQAKETLRHEGASQEAPSPPATFLAEEITLTSVKEVWKGILENIPFASVRISLKDAIIQSVEKGTVTIAFSSQFHREKVTDPKASREVERLLSERFSASVHLQCVLREESVAPVLPADSKEVNMAEAVAEIFGR